MARSSSMSISKESVAEESARMDCLGMKRVRRRMEIMLFRGSRRFFAALCSRRGHSSRTISKTEVSI